MILIVDDKQENLFSLKKLLQLNKYEAETASSGEEALKMILQKEYELIILDVQMPGMDGYEVAEAVTGYSRTKNIPIIFLSAVNIDKGFITRGYISGGVDYVIKPFDPDLLMLKIKTFSRLYEQTRELKQMQDVLKEEIESRKNVQQELEKANLRLEDKVNERTAELLKINQELEVSNLELQQYASVASHDLQEPLRKIINFGQMVADQYLVDNPEASKLMNKIINATERMRNLINDLLDYSKISMNSKFIFTDLKTIISETTTDLDYSVNEKKASIITGELPMVEVVPGQFRQVFQNILSNALKFSKKDVAPVIRIWGERIASYDLFGAADPEGQYLRIFIADNGIGFNEVFLDKIFTMFQRLHGRFEYEGTGIGLAIVKKIIEKHNGIITAKSKEGEGTTFIIMLPVKQPSPIEIPAA